MGRKGMRQRMNAHLSANIRFNQRFFQTLSALIVLSGDGLPSALETASFPAAIPYVLLDRRKRRFGKQRLPNLPASFR
ncbi:hypothetical protein ABEW32_10795 [Paenibacillus jamilae]|uniref:hypothetical protein n=1 Tax=Paenibacillus jamilae TaxID=114136 RepID=UPI003D29098E